MRSYWNYPWQLLFFNRINLVIIFGKLNMKEINCPIVRMINVVQSTRDLKLSVLSMHYLFYECGHSSRILYLTLQVVGTDTIRLLLIGLNSVWETVQFNLNSFPYVWTNDLMYKANVLKAKKKILQWKEKISNEAQNSVTRSI